MDQLSLQQRDAQGARRQRGIHDQLHGRQPYLQHLRRPPPPALGKATGKQQELKQALFKANFTDNRDVSDPDELVTIAASVGLDGSEAREVLASDRYAAEVRAEEKLWMSRGIHAVPGIVINGKWLISGGQPPDYFEHGHCENHRRGTGPGTK